MIVLLAFAGCRSPYLTLILILIYTLPGAVNTCNLINQEIFLASVKFDPLTALNGNFENVIFRDTPMFMTFFYPLFSFDALNKGFDFL